jgi:hypothetical protein
MAGAGRCEPHIPLILAPNAFSGSKKGQKTNMSRRFAK